MGRTALLLALAAALVAPAVARAQSEAPPAIDWAEVNRHSTVEVITVDPDGDKRETKVWVCVVDGAGWLRTNDTRWYANLERDPEAVLRYGDVETPVLAERVTDSEQRTRVDDACREKYGWQQKLMEFFGGTGGRNLLRLVPRLG